MQAAACQTITGQAIDSGARCLRIIQEQVGGKAAEGIPPRSAVDAYLEISNRIPADVEVKISELDINEDRVRIKGETKDFDAIDRIVDGLRKGKCLANVSKGKARNVNDGVEFQLSLDLDCQAAPGEPLPAKTGEPKKRSTALRTNPQRAHSPLAEPPVDPPSAGSGVPEPAPEDDALRTEQREARRQKIEAVRRQQGEVRNRRLERLKSRRAPGTDAVTAEDE